jgi:phosphinothricin acetyltransferase
MAIREAVVADAEAMLAIYAPFVSDSAVSFELTVPDAAEFANRIERGSAAHPWIVFVQAETVVGYAYASEFRTRAAYAHTSETTVYVAPEARGLGVGTALMSELISRLRQQGAHLAVAAITLPNEPSVALHERLGFEPVGVFHDVGHKFDEWHDVGFWQLRLE